MKVWGEVENIKGGGGGGGGGGGSGGDGRDFRLPRPSLDLMKWKGGAAERRRERQDEGLYF